MSFTTPDSGHSHLHTPSRGQPPSGKSAKSSPVGKVTKYHIPKNCKEYQEFGYDPRFILEPLRNHDEFLKFLDLDTGLIPETVSDVPSRGKGSFLELANKLAKFIQQQSEHYLFLCLAFLLTYNFTLDFKNHPILEFRDTGNKPQDGHVMDTKCRPNIMAALQCHWKNGAMCWPLIRLAGEVGSKGKGPGDQSKQAISYLHYLLLARPDLDVAQGLLTDDDKVSFFFGIGGKGIWQFNVEWKDPDLNKSLYAFIYCLYEPGAFADPSYITKVDDKTMEAMYTIKIKNPGGPMECGGFYSIYARNPFATCTHVLSNPTFTVEGKVLTIFKDQLCHKGRHFEELEILNDHVHKMELVPGVVAVAYGQKIEPPLSKERHKYCLGLGESGLPFMSIPILSDMLEMSFDVLEGI